MVCCLSVLLSGCTGLFPLDGGRSGKPEAGTVVGQVVDAGGEGLPGVTIRVEGTDIAAVTDDSGRFELRYVPVGPQKLNAAFPLLAPFTPLGVDGNQSAITMDVVVHANQTTQVSIRIPVNDGLNHIALLQAAPHLNEPLQAGEEVAFAFDIAYALQPSKGEIVLLLVAEFFDGTTEVVKEFAAPITSGAASIRIEGSALVPESPGVGIVVALLGGMGELLAINSLSPYPVTGVEAPFPPILQVNDISLGYVTLSWHGSVPDGFLSYELYRSALSFSTPSASAKLIGRITDPNAYFMIDDFAPEGYRTYYRLFVRTDDGRNHSSNLISLELPRVGESEVLVPNIEIIQDTVMDPSRPILYVTDAERNYVLALSTVTGTVVDTIPVASRPTKMGISHDGTKLAVANYAQTISVIDLTTQTTSLAPGLDDIEEIVVDSVRNRLYVLTKRYSSTSLAAIDLSTGTVAGPVPVPQASDLVVSADGTTVLFRSPTTLFAYDADSLTEKASTIPPYRTHHLVAHPNGEIVFSGNIAYDIHSLTRLETLPSPVQAVRAIDPTATRMVAVGPEPGGTREHIFILDHRDGEWVITDKISFQPTENYKIFLTNDGMKLYLPRASAVYDETIITIDLELRSLLAP